ncbi:hypothetical protein IG631_08667 [Alternaria alternata]|nr:hypothetical protein IG631_08667 [Alternaria alternata]
MGIQHERINEGVITKAKKKKGFEKTYQAEADRDARRISRVPRMMAVALHVLSEASRVHESVLSGSSGLGLPTLIGASTTYFAV